MKQLKDYIKPTKETQRVFVVIKPGFLHLAPQIINFFENNGGWEVERMKSKRLLYTEASKLYENHRKEEWFKPLCNYMSSDICQGIIFKRRGNNFNPFDSVKSLKKKIREKYGESDMRNVLHASDNKTRFDIESHIFF